MRHRAAVLTVHGANAGASIQWGNEAEIFIIGIIGGNFEF